MLETPSIKKIEKMVDKFPFIISCSSWDIKINPLLAPMYSCFGAGMLSVAVIDVVFDSAKFALITGLFFSFIAMILSIFYDKNLKKNLKRGILIFYDDYLEIVENDGPRNILYYSDISHIKIRFLAKKGDVFSPRGRPALGNDNKIIITKDEVKITKYILCEALSDYLRLKILGKYLKEKGLDVKMKGF